MCAAVTISGLEPIEHGPGVAISRPERIRLRLMLENVGDAYSGSPTIF
jgi:hypothetical protein